MFEEIERDYIQWLCNRVSIGDPGLGIDSGFLKLTHRLWDSKVTPETAILVGNDENRIHDGLKLREMFADEYNMDIEVVERDLASPCSVLEMMIGISIRMDFEIGLSNDEEHVDDFFWELLDNLGLQKYDDLVYDIPKNTEEIDFIIYNFLNRKYKYDGSGGLFPLMNPRRNQRNVEIWYQMMDYLDENYPI